MGHDVKDCTKFRAKIHDGKGYYVDTHTSDSISSVREEARRIARLKENRGGEVEIEGLSKNWNVWTTLATRKIPV